LLGFIKKILLFSKNSLLSILTEIEVNGNKIKKYVRTKMCRHRWRMIDQQKYMKIELNALRKITIRTQYNLIFSSKGEKFYFSMKL
jgi:ABC-type cobalamin transport system ATPase subunit